MCIRDRVYATSRQPEKLKLSLEMGADAVINTKEQDLKEEITRLTNGEMCDVVIDNIGIREMCIRDRDGKVHCYLYISVI